METMESTLDVNRITNIEVVGQTPHEMILEKANRPYIEKSKRQFAKYFFTASNMIYGHTDDYLIKTFCKIFSAEERIVLERGLSRHPMFKTYVTFFLSAPPLLWIFYSTTIGVIPPLGSALVGISATLLSLYNLLEYCCIGQHDALASHPAFLTKYFFMRRKFIRLHGQKAVEDAIRDMERAQSNYY